MATKSSITRRAVLAGSLAGSIALGAPRLAFAKGSGTRNLLFVILRGAADGCRCRHCCGQSRDRHPPVACPAPQRSVRVGQSMVARAVFAQDSCQGIFVIFIRSLGLFPGTADAARRAFFGRHMHQYNAFLAVRVFDLPCCTVIAHRQARNPSWTRSRGTRSMIRIQSSPSDHVGPA